jgi:hypothetical protein
MKSIGGLVHGQGCTVVAPKSFLFKAARKSFVGFLFSYKTCFKVTQKAAKLTQRFNTLSPTYFRNNNGLVSNFT